MKSKNYSLSIKVLIFLPLSLLFFICTFFLGYYTTEYYINPTNSSIPILVTSISKEVATDQIDFTEVQGIKNILLISTDTNLNEEFPHSDSMMILTIDNINKKLKLTSLLTDMLVDIKSHGEERLNQAFSYGEAGKTIETIQNNFGIKIDNYIVINFAGFKEVIDNLEGVSLNIKDYELTELNKNIITYGGTTKDLISNTGTHNLNGIQTLAYSKICNTSNGEYEKVSRQRTMFQATVNKFKDSSPLALTTMLKDLLPYIKTNINITNAINYTLTSFNIGTISSFNIEQFTLPIETIAQSANFESKGNVIIIDKEENATALQEFIFNDNINYTPDKINLTDIVNKSYSDYGNMDESTAEAYIENIPIEEQYLYDYAKELDIEDFLEDNWSNKTNTSSQTLDDEVYYNDLDYSDCDESWN